MKIAWIVAIIVILSAYFLGMYYYEHNKNVDLSPKDCECPYKEGDFFANSMIVKSVTKNGAMGYCALEYGYPLGTEKFTSISLCV